MKKNCDYFEMLKCAAKINRDIFENILENKQNGTNRLDFKALKSELIKSLIDEFVPPIERTDIYLLFSGIELIYISLLRLEAFNKVSSFNTLREYMLSLKAPFFDFYDAVERLSSFKSPKRLADIVSCNKKQLEINLNGLSRKLALSGDICETQYFSALYDFSLTVFNADTQIEKILINNN